MSSRLTPKAQNASPSKANHRKSNRIELTQNTILKAAMVVDNKRTDVKAVNISRHGISLQTKERYGLKTSDTIIVHLYFYDTIMVSYHLTVKHVNDCIIGAVFSRDNTMSNILVFENFVNNRYKAA